MKIGIPILTMKQKWSKFIWKKQFFFLRKKECHMKMCLSVKISMIITHSLSHTQKKEYFGEMIENYKVRKKDMWTRYFENILQKPVKGPLK